MSASAPLQPTRPVGSKQPVPPPAAAAASSSPASPRAAVSVAKATPELERKRKLVRSIQVLRLATKEQHCSEDDLVQALAVVSFTDGEYVFCQGQTERDVYFIEEGRVLITQRRAGTGPGRIGAHKRSLQEAELEIQIMTHEELEYFGEMALLQNAQRKSNAVASGGTTCMVLKEPDFRTLLAPLHQLMLYRHLLRSHAVLEKHRLFKDFSPAQRMHIINHCVLETFRDGEVICRQGELDDRYFIVAEGEANVVLDEPVANPDSRATSLSMQLDDIDKRGGSAKVINTMIDGVQRSDGRHGCVQSSTVAHKSLFQGFGEMGLLDKPRTAHVVARGDVVVCAIVRRKDYIGASQLPVLLGHSSGGGGATAMDADAESLLATTLIEEWNLVVNARNLHLSNPHVAHYLVTFIKKFKAAYNQKFVGKTMYLDLLRRLHHEPQLGDEFAFVTSRVAWDSPASSLSILRSETRRILSAPPADRSPAEMSFIGRLLEPAAFVDKFELPPSVDRHKVARHIGRVAGFVHIGKDTPLFRQGKVESRAFMILRGKIHIVNEDVNALQTLRHCEVIATLAAGDSFGELTLVARLPRSATAIAACDADLLVLDRERLQLLKSALPGVDVRHEMVERAAFLAQLDFFKGCDFGQCIRVAHDMHAVAYEPRHVFLREAAHLRTLYIVQSGEIAVFVKKVVSAAALRVTTVAAPSPAAAPVAVAVAVGMGMAAAVVGATSSSSPSAAADTAPPLAPTKTVLVRVATIGPQEFFGVAIALAAIAGAPSSVGGASAAAAVTSAAAANSSSSVASVSGVAALQHQTQHPLHTAPTQAELAGTVFMCCTRVCVLELSERGWRRLAPSSLQRIRSALLERNRWHHALVDAPPREPSYYHIERPWQILVRANPVTGEAEQRQTTQLARHVRAKRESVASTPALFRASGGDSESTSSSSASWASSSLSLIHRSVLTTRAGTGAATATATCGHTQTSRAESVYSSPRREQPSAHTPAALSPRSPAFVLSGLPSPRSSSSLGGSFSPGAGIAHAPHSPLALAPSACASPLSPVRHVRAAPSGADFVRVLAPILPLPLAAGAASPSRSGGGRTARSSPGRTEASSSSSSTISSSSSSQAAGAFEAMWKLPRRPSLQ